MTKRICSVERCPELARKRDWCSSHYERWRRHGDPEGGRYNYAIDESYFDNIDTEAKAYWLGFITADGCVAAGPVGANGWQRNQLSVKLKASDAGHLEKLKSAMSAGSPVRFLQTGKPSAAAEIAVTSEHLVRSLIRLGVTPRKSLTVEPWTGPVELMRHYWRGLVDGDGTIVRHPGERDKWRITLLGTRAIVEGFRQWAAPLCASAAESHPKNNIWSWTIGGLAAPQSVARELYGDATVFLDRKHALARQLMAVPARHRSRCGEAAGITPSRTRAGRSPKTAGPDAA